MRARSSIPKTLQRPGCSGKTATGGNAFQRRQPPRQCQRDRKCLPVYRDQSPVTPAFVDHRAAAWRANAHSEMATSDPKGCARFIHGLAR